MGGNQGTRKPRGNLAYLIILGIYLGSVLLVDPRGEFPLNDDWSFSRSAFRFARENRVQVDEWCAMSLAGQALYGGLLAKLFGPAFLLLRLSTLALSCALSLLLWQIFAKLKVPTGLAWTALLAWIFNPIQFCLSFTYMTEIPFLFFAGLGFYCFIHALERQSTGLLAASGSALGYAFLIRQSAILIFAALVITLILIPGGESLRRRIHRALSLALPVLIAAAGYYLWLISHGGPTPAARRKFELLGKISREQVLGNLFGSLFYLSFMLLPLLAGMLPCLIRIWKETVRMQRWLIPAIWLGISAAGSWWFHSRYAGQEYFMSRAYHSRMPYLLNVLYDTGLGPLTLDPTYYRTPPTPVYPNLWQGISLMSGAGLVLLGILCTAAVARTFRSQLDWKRRATLICSLLAAVSLVIFEIIFSHVEEGGLFDRHLLIPALPSLISLVVPTGTDEPRKRGGHGDPTEESARPSVRSAPRWLALALVALLGYFSVAATRDYLQWNRLRWEIGTELLARKVNPLTVAGGFEFNGWHNYDTFRARGNIGNVYYWWYDGRTYLISMSPEEGYEILDRREYFSWVHRLPVSIYLLKKSGE